MLLATYSAILWLGFLPVVLAIEKILGPPRHQSQMSDPAGMLDVFQAYQPVPTMATGTK